MKQRGCCRDAILGVTERIHVSLAYPRATELRYTPSFVEIARRASAALGVARLHG